MNTLVASLYFPIRKPEQLALGDLKGPGGFCHHYRQHSQAKADSRPPLIRVAHHSQKHLACSCGPCGVCLLHAAPAPTLPLELQQWELQGWYLRAVVPGDPSPPASSM
ncbi:hypothetical protein KIL84_018495 [Mauremys mutica]|uniref:Uncharacterized protein n=1 Tax=Mauremys mutica TaxID=74926 RepID=A0A9D4B9G5_9SAUR|nr:hypothetical protein KIL84_018495 [Mauremys mutica]